MNKRLGVRMGIATLIFFMPFFVNAAPTKSTKKGKTQKKSATQKQEEQQEKALASRQEKPIEFWDKVTICFAKNYREQHPDHFIPQMSDRQCTVFALQNSIPSVMNLDPNLMEFVIKKVAELHDKSLTVDLEGWTVGEIVQAMTDALNRQIEAENKANGYDNTDEEKKDKKVKG